MHRLETLHTVLWEEGRGFAHVIKVPLRLRSTGVFGAAEVSVLTRGGEVLHIGPEEALAFGHMTCLREAVSHLGGLFLKTLRHFHHGFEGFRAIIVERHAAFPDGL